MYTIPVWHVSDEMAGYGRIWEIEEADQEDGPRRTLPERRAARSEAQAALATQLANDVASAR